MKKIKMSFSVVAITLAFCSALAADSLAYFIVFTPGGGTKRIAANRFEQNACTGINVVCAQEYQDNQLLTTLANGPYTAQ